MSALADGQHGSGGSYREARRNVAHAGSGLESTVGAMPFLGGCEEFSNEKTGSSRSEGLDQRSRPPTN